MTETVRVKEEISSSSLEKILRQNYYQRLGVPVNATQEEIKIAYLSAIKKFHPDPMPMEFRPLATAISQAINEAYAELSDPAKREQYDATVGVFISVDLSADEKIDRMKLQVQLEKELKNASSVVEILNTLSKFLQNKFELKSLRNGEYYTVDISALMSTIKEAQRAATKGSKLVEITEVLSSISNVLGLRKKIRPLLFCAFLSRLNVKWGEVMLTLAAFDPGATYPVEWRGSTYNFSPETELSHMKTVFQTGQPMPVEQVFMSVTQSFDLDVRCLHQLNEWRKFNHSQAIIPPSIALRYKQVFPRG